jgi:hypothetical protein
MHHLTQASARCGVPVARAVYDAAAAVAPERNAQAAEKLAAYLDSPATQVAHALAPEDHLPRARELHLRVADILGDTKERR